MPSNLDRAIGASLSGGYTRGPAAGVDYFSDTGTRQGESNVNPGLPSLTSDKEAPDAGARAVAPEPYRSSNSSYDTGGSYVSGGGYTSPEDAALLGKLGTGAAMLGMYTQDPALAMFGGATNAMAAATQGNYAPAASMAGGLAFGPAGAVGGNLLGQYLSDGQMSVRDVGVAGLGYAVPGYGIVNSLTGGKLGDLTFGSNAKLTDNGTMTAPAKPGLLGSLGLQQVAPTTNAFGTPTSATQTGTMNSPDGGYSFSSVATPTGLSGQLGNLVASPTGFNSSNVPGFNVMSGFDTTPSATTPSVTTPSDTDSGSDSDSGSGRPAGGGYTGDAGGDYADGGMIGSPPGLPTGGPSGPMLAQGFAAGGQVQMGAMNGQSSPEQVNTQVNQLLRDPQVRQKLVARAQQLMQSGQLTPQEVTTMAQVAEASLNNPSLYPQLRAFVVEQGMAPLPPAYDQSVIMKIMAVARALQQAQPATPPGQVPPTDQAQMQNPVPGMANGGYLQGPGTGRSDSIGTVNQSTGAPVKVANGEYVIPEHVVRAKGREFFDNLLRRYADVPKEQA